MSNSKSKSNKTDKTPGNKRSVVNNGKISSNDELRDKYFVPYDYIWRDCILNERKSAQLWTETWDCSVPGVSQPKLKKPAPLDSDDIKAIQYKKSSDMIGNYLRRPSFPFGEDIIHGKIYHAPPKIRFTQEQYGYYRMQKYLANNNSSLEESRYPVSRYVRHDVYPLLC